MPALSEELREFAYSLPVDCEGLYHAVTAMDYALDALEMVRDADNDCRADGLPTMPDLARAKIDRAIAKLKGE